MNFIKLLAPFLTAIFFLNSNVNAAEVTDLKEAELYVKEIGDRAVDLLASKEIAQHVRNSKIRIILTDVMAADTIARIVLGKPWRKMEHSQKEEYISLFREYLLTKYSGLVGSYNGQTIEINKTVRAGKADAMVFTTIAQTGTEGVKVGWRIRTVKGMMKLLDVKIEDISMVQTEREQFQNVYQNVKIVGLLDTLRTLTQKMQEASKKQQASNN